MKKIVNGLLYDTDKSQKIMEAYLHSVYKSPNGRLFVIHDILNEITCTDQNLIKKFIGEYNADLYQQLFGEVKLA